MAELHWTAPEFEHHEKTVSWYWLTIIAAVLAIGFAVWQKNFLFGIFVVLAEMLILIWANKQPRIIRFSITERGFVVDDDRTYHFQEIKNFSIDQAHPDDAEHTELTLHLKNHIRPAMHVRIPVGEMANIKKLMGLKVRETPFELSLTEALEKFFRF